MASQSIRFDELVELVDGDREKAERIWEVSKDVSAYANHKAMQGIGIVFGPNDLSFERAMIFSWIKEAIDK